MSDIRIDDDGFLVGDGEQQRTEAENVLMQDIKTDTTAIVNLLKGTVKLQRDALKAAQSADKPKSNQSNSGNSGNSGNALPRVNLVHPNRANNANNQSQRVNLNHPNRPPANNSNVVQANDTARPRIQQNQGGNAGSPTPQEGANGRNGTARVNRQRDANGRFIGDNTQANDESTQRRGNRDSRGRFTGGDGSAADRSAVSRITDSLKDLNSNLTLNADTDRIDPMVDAIKEASGIVSVGIDASKKVLSVGNTLIAKPAMALGRGIKGLFKPKTDVINSPTSWYKRIWRTLERGNRQDQTQHNQEQRRLDELVRGQGQGGGSNNSGLLMMLGLGLAALLAAFKNFKIPEMPSLSDIKDFIADAINKAIKEVKEALTPDFGGGGKSAEPAFIKPVVPKVTGAPKVNLNHPTRPPITPVEPTKLQKAFNWAKETKAGKVFGAVGKKLPYVAPTLETLYGGSNAYDIENDKNLTPEQKRLKQAENAGKTGGRIVGGLGGAAAGGKAALLLTVKTMNPWIIVPSVLAGSALGGIYGADILGDVGEKAGGGVYKSRKNNKDKDKKKFVEPSAYADRDSEARKLYEEHKRLDVDGSGIITRDEMIKGGRSDLLGEPEKAQTTQKGFTPEKAKSIKAMSERLGVNPNDVAQLMSFETGRTFDPNARNKGSSATGIFQLMGKGATKKGSFNDGTYYGMTRDQFGALSFDDQILYFEKYLKERGIGKNGKTSLPDMYDAVLGYGYKKGSKAFAANPDLDVNGNDVIDKGEAVTSKKFQQHKKQYFPEIPTNTPKAVVTPTVNTPTNTVPTLKTAPVTASPVPNVQSVQSVQAKEQPTRHNTTPTPIKVSFAKPLVGQNVSDRGIAHILTGGIGETV